MQMFTLIIKQEEEEKVKRCHEKESVSLVLITQLMTSKRFLKTKEGSRQEAIRVFFYFWTSK
jgi:hypothetical protein